MHLKLSVKKKKNYKRLSLDKRKVRCCSAAPLHRRALMTDPHMFAIFRQLHEEVSVGRTWRHPFVGR